MRPLSGPSHIAARAQRLALDQPRQALGEPGRPRRARTSLRRPRDRPSAPALRRRRSRPLRGSICGWNRTSICSCAITAFEHAVALRDGGRRCPAVRRPPPPLTDAVPFQHDAWRLTPALPAPEAGAPARDPKRDSDAWRVNPLCFAPVPGDEEQRLTADAPTRRRRGQTRSRRASASACCRRTREVAQAAEAMLRARYRLRRRRAGARRWSRSAATASCSRRCTTCSRADAPTPVFGMNRGTVGFLMNEWRIDGLRRADRRGQGDPRRAARDARDDGRRRNLHPRRDQRSLAAARNPPDGEDRDFGQRPRGDARAGLRRRAGRDAGRLDRLQPLGPRADPAACRRRCWR